MNRDRHHIAILIVTMLLLGLAATAQAGAVFDDILNYPVMDQVCPSFYTRTESLGLAGQKQASFITLTKEKSLGQTFKVGPRADVLWKINVGLCYYPDNWVDGEEVTFTLWDSTAKTKKLYSRTLDFRSKWHKWDTAFDVHIPTRPDTEYYFELTHNGGGDNSINVITIPGDDYKRGQAYVAGQPRADTDLYFIATSKPKGDRTENLKKFLSQFDYDYPALAEAGKAYNSGAYERACELILRHFETRTTPDSLAGDAIPAGKVDTTRVDYVCDQGRYYKKVDKLDVWVDMNDQTNWRETWPNSADYIRQNDLFRSLGEAYQATGNEKYATKLNELMLDYVQDNASPYEGAMRGGRWVAMFVAWRLGDAWDGWGKACQSKGLSDDVKLGWIDYERRMGDFVEREPSGGNQENASAEALMQFAMRFPEFKNSRKWSQQGYNRLMTNSLDLFRPDGGSTEPTMNYQGYALGFLIEGYETAKAKGLELPKEIWPRLEKIHEYIAYILMPDGQGPSNGDTNCQDFRPRVDLYDSGRSGQVMRGADWFKREDLRYIATQGKQGKRPEQTSILFPDSRYAVMRSDWGGEGGKDYSQARYMLFRAGYDGGHSHMDYNSVMMYAYGRPLLIDPGRTGYGTPLMKELGNERSHNVLLVDGLAMSNPDPTPHAWHTTPVLDVIDNEYKGLYPGVDHRRAVVFVKPDYYVMFDHAVADKAHSMGINFWLTPPDVTINKGFSNKPGQQGDPAAGVISSASIVTNEPRGSNVLVRTEFSRMGAETDVTQRKGTLDLGGVRDDIPVVTCWEKNTAQADFATLLYPFPGKAQGIETGYVDFGKGTNDDRLFSTKTPRGTDYVYYAPTDRVGFMGMQLHPEGGKPASMFMQCRTGLIRTDKAGNVVSFCLIGGTKARCGRDLALCSKPVEELSVEYGKGVVTVTCPKPERSLVIASLGRTQAVVNGKKVAVKGDTFKPFK